MQSLKKTRICGSPTSRAQERAGSCKKLKFRLRRSSRMRFGGVYLWGLNLKDASPHRPQSSPELPQSIPERRQSVPGAPPERPRSAPQAGHLEVMKSQDAQASRRVLFLSFFYPRYGIKKSRDPGAAWILVLVEAFGCFGSPRRRAQANAES